MRGSLSSESLSTTTAVTVPQLEAYVTVARIVSQMEHIQIAAVARSVCPAVRA